jgi:hypothetical protein
MGIFKGIISKLFGKRSPDPKLTNLGSGKTFEEKFDEEGVFHYEEDGFSIQDKDLFTNIKWDNITQLNVYKKDLMTIDRIEMEIVCGDKAITISEDLPGWYQFVLKTKSIFHTVPKDWDIAIINSAFEANWKNIYSKT